MANFEIKIINFVKTDIEILGDDQQIWMALKGGIDHAILSLRVALKTQIRRRSC